MPDNGAYRVGPGSTVDVDVAVIGAGVAGLVVALDLLDRRPELAIAVIDKGTMGSTGSTPLAQGGMAAAVGADDSPLWHAEDTLRAGDGLGDPSAVHVMAREAPARVADLLARGAALDRCPDGTLHLAREGGQRVPRSVHAADATGAEIFRALRTAATGRVTRLQGIAFELAVTAGAVTGVWVVWDAVDASRAGPAQEAGIGLVRARETVLATGGCGGMFAATTNRDGATADGVALAWRAGAALVDLEFVQFHPTGALPRDAHGGGFWRVLLTEALRGAGARLVDAHGQRFMADLHPDAELAPRHIVAKGILDQPRGAWLDATGLGAERLRTEFPTAVSGAQSLGYDLTREPIPVEPAEHYMIGGVATDLHGATSVPGLHAVGETASTGVHGANRMAGNSLAQSCVFAHRLAVALAHRLSERRADPADPDEPTVTLEAVQQEPDAHAALRAELRRAMSDGAGALRSGTSLARAAARLGAIDHRLGTAGAAARDWVELRHVVTAARLIIRSARLREESRGVHWREDFPARQPAWDGVRLRVQRGALAYPDAGKPRGEAAGMEGTPPGARAEGMEDA